MIERAQTDIVKAAEAVGYSEVLDLEDLHIGNNVERAMRWILSDGERQDAAHTFIQPLL